MRIQWGECFWLNLQRICPSFQPKSKDMFLCNLFPTERRYERVPFSFISNNKSLRVKDLMLRYRNMTKKFLGFSLLLFDLLQTKKNPSWNNTTAAFNRVLSYLCCMISLRLQIVRHQKWLMKQILTLFYMIRILFIAPRHSCDISNLFWKMQIWIN